MNEVTTEQVTEFIHARPYSDTTKNHTRSFLNTAFKWFKKSKWLLDNPVEPIPPIKVTRQEPGILTVEETKQLFAANQDEDPEICGLLALGAFGGMRASAIERLSQGEIRAFCTKVGALKSVLLKIMRCNLQYAWSLK